MKQQKLKFDSRTISKYLLFMAKESMIRMNVTKTHKLLYILDGSLLAIEHDLVNENPRAWQFGPVYPKVHKMLSENSIYKLSTYEDGFEELDKTKIKDITQNLLATLGSRTASELSAWSHHKNSPWAQSIKNNHGKQNCIIEKSLMVAYFKTQLGGLL